MTKQIEIANKAIESINDYLASGTSAVQHLAAVVKMSASSKARKAVEAHILDKAREADPKKASTPEVMRLRALFGEIKVGENEKRWTIQFGKDKKSGELNACFITRSKGSATGSRNRSNRGEAIKATKDLTSLLQYAIDHYGVKATADELTRLIKENAKQAA